jgi:hypothetical protein
MTGCMVFHIVSGLPVAFVEEQVSLTHSKRPYQIGIIIN